MNPMLVEVLRGATLESSHAGAIAVVDADGTQVAALGDIDRPVFPRSAIKVLQALPLVASGAAERLGLVDAELALACASHNGEPEHVATAAAMVAKAGMASDALECGTHWPMHDATARALAAAGGRPSALHNNCSGKHAGFVCLACTLGTGGRRDLRDFTRGYVDPAHPVMREVTAATERTTGVDLGAAPHGIDGCSIPTYAIPLRRLAHAFARVGTGVGLPDDLARAARRLREAVAAAPFMVGGTGRFDTQVMDRLGARVFCKVGAEGVYCAAFPDQGLGLAIKVDDGNNARAAEVAMAAAIEAIVPLDAADAAFVAGFSDRALTNWNGIEVGRLRASAALREALRGASRSG